MRWLGVSCVAILASGLAFAAPQRDFLTEDEADQVREAQDPNERLLRYTKFARLRLELIRQALENDKAGRAKLIHDNLADYSKIIEAMDSVIDDALMRKVDLTKGIAIVADQEKAFVKQLEQFSAKQARDRGFYEFALKDALESTQDSLEESQNDLRERAHKLQDEDVRDRKKRESESVKSPAEAEKRQAEAKQAESGPAEDKAKKTPKAPTLRRKGEAPKEP
jgi:hypothetical protein